MSHKKIHKKNENAIYINLNENEFTRLILKEYEKVMPSNHLSKTICESIEKKSLHSTWMVNK